MILLAVGCPIGIANAQSAFDPVKCPGTYGGHLQGICTDGRDAIFWSFTTALVKTDSQGKLLAQIDVADHHGDLCFHDGQIYVAVNFGLFNHPEGKADCWIIVYDADDLTLVGRHAVPEVFHGAGGLAHHDDKFLVVGGLPVGTEENYVYEYDAQRRFVTKHTIASGYTRLGIQTATFADGHWWFGCYGNEVLKIDESLNLVGKYRFDCGLGIVSVPGGKFLIGRGEKTDAGYTGAVVVARPDAQQGLVIDSP